MAELSDIITSYTPSNGAVGVPLLSTISVTFDRLMDEDDLAIEFFLAGPDTDQYIGPGISQFNLYPDNVSQGDDFLESPGYTGIVTGTFSFETVAGVTVLTFSPTQPMAPLIEYTAHLPQAKDATGTTHTGHVIFGWTSGSGSIEAMPSTSSLSVLTSISQVTSLSALTDLEVDKTIPADNTVGQDVDLSTIEVYFNKAIESTSVSNTSVSAKAIPATDHPSAVGAIERDLAIKLTTEGKKIIIEI